MENRDGTMHARLLTFDLRRFPVDLEPQLLFFYIKNAVRSCRGGKTEIREWRPRKSDQMPTGLLD